MAVIVNIIVLWDVNPCTMVEVINFSKESVEFFFKVIHALRKFHKYLPDYKGHNPK
jgi:hypothetical protein